MNVLARIPADIYAALLFVTLGVAAFVFGSAYPLGTIAHMGPGFFPRIIAVLLIVLGVAIAVASRTADARVLRPTFAEARGWVCIVAAIGAFIVLGAHVGLIPATFAIVFISALGTPNNSIRDAGLLAAGMTVLGVVIFGLILKIQMPLVGWN